MSALTLLEARASIHMGIEIGSRGSSTVHALKILNVVAAFFQVLVGIIIAEVGESLGRLLVLLLSSNLWLILHILVAGFGGFQIHPLLVHIVDGGVGRGGDHVHVVMQKIRVVLNVQMPTIHIVHIAIAVQVVARGQLLFERISQTLVLLHLK